VAVAHGPLTSINRATLFARVEARAALGSDASDADTAVLADQLAAVAYERAAFWMPLLEALLLYKLHPATS
jgi:uncharacterized protein